MEYKTEAKETKSSTLYESEYLSQAEKRKAWEKAEDDFDKSFARDVKETSEKPKIVKPVFEKASINNKNEEPFIGIDDLSTHLGVSINTIYKWTHGAKNNGFPFSKPGRSLLFKKSIVEKWINKYKSDGDKKL